MRLKTRLLIYPIFASAMAALVGNLFGLCNAFAVDSSVDIKVNIEPVLSLSVTQPEAIAINANNINTLQTSDFTASAATNNITGYTLTMSSTTTDLVNNAVMVEGSYPVIPTLESNVTATNFPENHWGMSYDNGSNYVPFTLSREIAHTTGPGNATPINMKVGTKVNLNLGSGIYSNTVNFHLVANQSIFTITWNANGGAVSPSSSTYNYGMPLGELPVPTQEGYDFKGWFTEATGGTEVTPETVVAADATYFAQWETKTLSSITYMQEMTSEICAASSIREENQLIDTRDNKRYLVVKYQDDRCWMNQNLALGGHETMTLTPNDTDIPSNWVLPASVSAGNWSGQYSSPEFYAYSADNPDDAYTYQYGNYYNMLAATAGSLIDGKGDAPNSICPKGWRLPTSSAAGELVNFAVLKYQWSSHSPAAWVMDSDPFGKLSGRYNGNLIEQGNSGYWWSSTTLVASVGFLWQTTFDMMEFVSYIYPAFSINDLSIDAGLSVRCIARKASTEVTITYDANGGTGAPSPTSASSEFLPFDITLSSTTPTKSGQSFVGWNTEQDGSGTRYQPGGTITVSSGTTLYAEWATPFTNPTFKLNETSIANITYMQEMNSTICSNMTQETQYQLKDSRDNKYYYVAKLRDGKCWMTQNLDIDIDSSRLYESTNTNLTAGTSWKPVSDTIHTTSTTVTGWINDYNIPYSADRGNVYSASGSSSSLSSIDCTITGKTNCHYHIGNHYNWSAAVASNDTSSKTSGTASDSICPKGWRLPTGGSSGEYKALITTAYSIASSSAGETALRSSPLWFVRSGYVSAGSLANVGSSGHYWSSTVRDSYGAYDLEFYSSSVNPTYSDGRNYGRSVRCIAQ